MSDKASGADMISCPYFDFYIATAFEVTYGSQGKARQGKGRKALGSSIPLGCCMNTYM